MNSYFFFQCAGLHGLYGREHIYHNRTLRNMIGFAGRADEFVATALGHDALRRVELFFADRTTFSLGGHVYIGLFSSNPKKRENMLNTS